MRRLRGPRPFLAPAPAFRDVWRLYLLLVLANELDLTFTYVGLATGTFVEANPLMAVLTRPSLRDRVQQALSLAATVYAGVLLAHAFNALARLLPARGPSSRY